MSTPVQYDADQKAEARARGTVTIGTRKFHPVKRSGKLMKALIAMTPDTPSRNEDGSDREPTKEESEKGIDLVYEQLTQLLRDEEGVSPEADWLQEELDFEDAQEMLRDLSPRPPKEAQPAR